MYSAILSTPGAPVALHCPVRLSAFFRCLWRTFSPGRSASSHLQQGRCVGYSVHIELHTAVQLPDPLVAPLSHVCQTEGSAHCGLGRQQWRPLFVATTAPPASPCSDPRLTVNKSVFIPNCCVSLFHLQPAQISPLAPGSSKPSDFLSSCCDQWRLTFSVDPWTETWCSAGRDQFSKMPLHNS